MLRVVVFLALLFPVYAFAQTEHQHHREEGQSRLSDGRKTTAPVQAGQAAFAAIQEIVALLEADPTTDWSKVDIEALRLHLIDMNNVTLTARVRSEAVEGGIKFIVSGADADVTKSIRRMVLAHAAAMNGVGGWNMTATETEDGAALTVLAPPKDAAKLRGLGFIGVMTRGMHHQAHHLMIARGDHPHG